MKLELLNIYKSFGEKKVLTDLSFSAESGKAFGILGRNGAGKTTTIRILMDVFPADSGRVLLDGKPIDYTKVGIGYLPEERGLYPKKAIIEQLVYFAELKGMSRKDATRSVDTWLERLGMTEYRNKRLDTLSKGNQQKIQLITALAHDPHIVILDEPFSGLDPVNAMLLKDVVKEQITLGKIVLFSSHQMNYIEEFCDQIAILNQGKAVDIFFASQRQRLFAVDAEKTRNVDCRENQVSQLLGLLLHTAVVDGDLQLIIFLIELVECAVDIVPIETDLGGLLLDLGTAHQCGKRFADALHRLGLRFLVLELHLDLVPVFQRSLFVLCLFVAEHMRMTDNQLFANAVANVVHIKAARLAFHFGVKRHLQQHIAQLLLEQLGVVCVDRLDSLVGFLDKIGADGLVRLRHVPGTAAG